MPEIPHQVLAKWAVGKPTIKALYVFGSYARGQARPDSDLDLAFEFINVDAPLSELIEKAESWKAELCQLTGVVVKDVRLITDPVAQGTKVLIFGR
jgi:predicted nucleotidyltransferase